jgi:mono/diheme cytochrome c family protein
MIAAATARVALCGPAEEIWSAKVQPLFDVQCSKCHGLLEQKSGLELDTPEAVLKGGDEGKVIVPGKPEESRLFQYLDPKSDPHMPPKKQLGNADIATVREWILAMSKTPENPTAKRATPRQYSTITEAVDGYVAEGWTKRGVKAAEPLDDRAWCRRIYLDLAGRIPIRAELESFLDAESKAKREELVDRLIASDEYAIHMRELWDVYLMGRVKRENQLERRGKSGWWAFLEYSFRENRPWNETVREFLVARPTKGDLKGAYWFLFERRDQHQAIAEAVAPVVYGTQVNCAQCHDHPLAREIKQAHYWGLVAAFNRSKNVREEGVGESAVGGNINFTNLKKESQPAVITLLNGKTLPEPEIAGDKKEEDADDKYVDAKAKVRVPKFSRRETFADAVTQDNPLLARAFVNRMWAVFMGRGLVHPADQMNARNAPSHPELLEWLAEDFAKSGYDVKRLLRGLVLSRVYGLGRGDAPPESFASAIERPLTAEQLAASWRVASGLAKEDEKLQRAVVIAIPEVLPKEYNATFQQAQFLENAPALAELLKPAPGNTAERIEKLETDRERVAETFIAVLGRSPDAEEASAAEEFLKERGDKKSAAVRDLLWALMTSAEFLTMP